MRAIRCCNRFTFFRASLPFVVIEKTQGAGVAPALGGLEAKLTSAARQLKALNSSARVLAYYQTDWVRTAYASGQWFESHPVHLLRNRSGQLVTNPRGANPGGGAQHVYDYSSPAAQAHWAGALANLTQPSEDHRGIPTTDPPTPSLGAASGVHHTWSGPLRP